MKIGDMVELKKGVYDSKESHATAKVQSFLENIKGGVYLDRSLRGIRYWNRTDLKTV